MWSTTLGIVALFGSMKASTMMLCLLSKFASNHQEEKSHKAKRATYTIPPFSLIR